MCRAAWSSWGDGLQPISLDAQYHRTSPKGRKNMMRWIPLLVIAVGSMVACPASSSAQTTNGLCNHVLRELGLFWSDGYHARHACCHSCMPDPGACGYQPGYPPVPAGSGYYAPPMFVPPSQPTYAPTAAPAPPVIQEPMPAPIPAANAQTWGVPRPVGGIAPVAGVSRPAGLPVYSQTAAWSAAFGP
jgi:hypothetical protein